MRAHDLRRRRAKATKKLKAWKHRRHLARIRAVAKMFTENILEYLNQPSVIEMLLPPIEVTHVEDLGDGSYDIDFVYYPIAVGERPLHMDVLLEATMADLAAIPGEEPES